MMSFFLILLTVVLVLDCLFLILLVLVQLPKKEAGMGQAFGGAATDALFGAGSGNALTKITKWAAGIFFALAIILTLMSNFAGKQTGGSRIQQLMSETPAATPPPVTAPATTPLTTPPANPAIQLDVPQTPPPGTPPAGTPAPANAAPPATAPAPEANK